MRGEREEEVSQGTGASAGGHIRTSLPGVRAHLGRLMLLSFASCLTSGGRVRAAENKYISWIYAGACLPALSMRYVCSNLGAIMLHLTLTRTSTSDAGTFGTLRGEGLNLYTAELPWRDNMPRISCIPAGRYLCRPYSSTRFHDVYELVDVPGRTAILIHSGNHAGDTAKGLRSDVQGCILVGLSRGILDGQEAVLNSRAAMQALRAAVGGDAFELIINDATGKAG